MSRKHSQLRLESLENRCTPSIVPVSQLPLASVTDAISQPAATTESAANQLTSLLQSSVQTSLTLDGVSVHVLNSDIVVDQVAASIGRDSILDVNLGGAKAQIGNLAVITLNKLELALDGQGLHLTSGGASASVADVNVSIGNTGAQIGGGGSNIGTGGVGATIGDSGVGIGPGGFQLGTPPDIGIIDRHLGGNSEDSAGLATLNRIAQWVDLDSPVRARGFDSGVEETVGADFAVATLAEVEAETSAFGFHAFDGVADLNRAVRGTTQTIESTVITGREVTDSFDISLKESDLLEEASVVQQLGIDSALQRLLACVERLASELAVTMMEAGLMPWLLAVLAACAAAEIVRRDLKRAEKEPGAHDVISVIA